MVDEDRMKRLEQFLIMLPANTIVVLGPMLSQVRFPRVQEHLMKIIGTLAKRDLRPLERLLSSSDESMVERLVFILGHLSGERPKEILSQMMNHQSDRVRRQALRQLISRDSAAIGVLFHLIDDSSTSIRNLILDNLGRNRDKKGEGLLVGYLKKQSFGVDTQEHLLACYKILGRCGSSRSLPFLRGLLLERSGLLDRNKSIHRQGAAIALMGIGTEEAKDILKNASRSLIPGVRSACRKALEANG
jgi:HEAT repeat protein